MAEPRIWDAYMTDAERAFYRDKRQEWGVRPAVLVIDIYNVVMGDRPEKVVDAVRRYPRTTGERGWQAIPHVQRLLATARAVGAPVIYTTKDARPEAAGVEWQSTKKGTKHGEWESAIFSAVAPEPGEPVIFKPRASAFFNTPMTALLNQLRVDTVIIVGESTSGCVRASTMDAFAYGFTTVVVEEGVWDRSWFTHCLNLFDMHDKFADVVGIDEVVAYLERLGDDRARPRS